MKLTALEKALLGYIGIEKVAPGTTKKALIGGLRLLPPLSKPVARGALGVGRAALGAGATLARRNPAVATGLGAVALQQAGAFDPVQEAIEMEVQQRVLDAQRSGANPIFGTVEDVITKGVPKLAKRKVSKYGKAIKAGMSAVKKSKFGGKPGKITNAKRTFSTVSKVTAAINKGKKVSAKGIRGTIGRAVRGILK